MNKLRDSKCCLDEQLSFVLYSTALAMGKAYKTMLKASGLTYSQYLIMRVLWFQDDISISDLAHQLFQDLGALSPVLKRLENMGYLRRQRATDDERKIKLLLTEQGRDLRQRVESLPDHILGASAQHSEHPEVLKSQLLAIRTQLHRFC